MIISEIYVIYALLYSLGSKYIVLDATMNSLPLNLLRIWLASGPNLKGRIEINCWPREDLDLQLSL